MKSDLVLFSELVRLLLSDDAPAHFTLVFILTAYFFAFIVSFHICLHYHRYNSSQDVYTAVDAANTATAELKSERVPFS